MESAQSVVSLDVTVFSATKNSEDAKLGDNQAVPAEPDVVDDVDPNVTYCPKGRGTNPASTKGTIRDTSKIKTSTSQSTNSSSHRSAANPSRYPSGFVTGASDPTKSSHSSKDRRKN